jgi:uncharacterized membrane protein
MTTLEGFRFFTTPGSVALSVGLVAVAAAASFVAWRRSGYDRGQGLLELLRLAIVGIAAVLLNQPEWIEERRSTEKPVVAVLCDASRSMDTRDVAATDGSGGPRTRRAAIAELAAEDFWRPLGDRFRVEIIPFSAAPPATASDYATALDDTRRRLDGLRCVVLAGDGDWNEGGPPAAAAQPLRFAQVPVIAVPVGAETMPPDVELVSLEAPSVGVAGKPVRIPFTIRSSLPTESVAVVVLETGSGEPVRKELRLPAMGTVTDWVTWTPREVGDAELTLRVPPREGELVPDNNEKTAPIAIRRERLKVLVVESVPRWEYRYLRNALSRDPGVEVSCLLFQPGLAKRGGGNRDYLPRFPEGLDELSRYDVVFLGDVGTGPDGLSAEECRRLAGLVEHQAAGLVFLPGFNGGQSTLAGTALEELLPVVVDSANERGFGTDTPRRLVLTEAGRASLLTRLAESPEANLAVWESLPGVQWYGPVLRAKAGSEVLAVHEDAANEHGRIPLIVTRTFGAGKVLYMATDGAWRWRKGVEDRYHYRFWGQVVRWMAYRRTMARGERMAFSFAPEQPQPGQSVVLDARVSRADGEPLSRGEVTARITAPSGTVETVRFVAPPGDGEWGVFTGGYSPREPGRHEVRLSCRETGDSLDASFHVQPLATEGIGRAARPEVLADLARLTRGRVVPVGEVTSILAALEEVPPPPPAVRRLKLWCHPAVALSVVGLSGLFWTLRKRLGLI